MKGSPTRWIRRLFAVSLALLAARAALGALSAGGPLSAALLAPARWLEGARVDALLPEQYVLAPIPPLTVECAEQRSATGVQRALADAHRLLERRNAPLARGELRRLLLGATVKSRVEQVNASLIKGGAARISRPEAEELRYAHYAYGTLDLQRRDRGRSAEADVAATRPASDVPDDTVRPSSRPRPLQAPEEIIRVLRRGVMLTTYLKEAAAPELPRKSCETQLELADAHVYNNLAVAYLRTPDFRDDRPDYAEREFSRDASSERPLRQALRAGWQARERESLLWALSNVDDALVLVPESVHLDLNAASVVMNHPELVPRTTRDLLRTEIPALELQHVLDVEVGDAELERTRLRLALRLWSLEGQGSGDPTWLERATAGLRTIDPALCARVESLVTSSEWIRKSLVWAVIALVVVLVAIPLLLLDRWLTTQLRQRRMLFTSTYRLEAESQE